MCTANRAHELDVAFWKKQILQNEALQNAIICCDKMTAGSTPALSC